MAKDLKTLRIDKYRKQKRKKSRKGFYIAAFVLAAFLIIIVTGLFLQVRKVSVTGSAYYTDEQMDKILFGDGQSRSVLVVFLKELLLPHDEIPFVESYKIRPDGLDGIKVSLVVKSMVGYVEFMGSNLNFDRDGMVVESSKDVYPDIPRVTGLKINSVVLGQTLPVESKSTLSSLLLVSQFLSSTAVEWQGEDKTLINIVDRIHFDSNENVNCYVGDISVVLGTGYNLESKLREMADILPSLSEKKGVLHLEGFDVSDGNRIYRFEEKEDLNY